MKEAYEYAQKFIKISKLMDECMHTMRPTQRSISLESSIIMHEFNDKMDVLFYNDYPVLDHKIAWGEGAFGYNFVANKPIERKMTYMDALIYDPSTNIFYANRDDIQSDDGIPYTMEFLDNESHMFQMELMLGPRFEGYCILHALHMLGYDKTAYMHVHTLNVLDKIIEEMEIYLDNHRYNKEF